MDIEKIIYAMLTESTGQALCDSGGAYGRHWEKNQKKSLKDFQNEKQVDYHIDGEYYTISVYHYLNCDDLEINFICKAFNKLNAKADNWDSDIMGVSKEAETLLNEIGARVKGSFNTYNGEDFLRQVLQGAYIELNNQVYVALQIHQGCDVRGGYTNARLFLLPNEFMPSQDVYGTIDGVSVDNHYDGCNLTNEDGEKVEIKKDSKVDLYLSSS